MACAHTDELSLTLLPTSRQGPIEPWRSAPPPNNASTADCSPQLRADSSEARPEATGCIKCQTVVYAMAGEAAVSTVEADVQLDVLLPAMQQYRAPNMPHMLPALLQFMRRLELAVLARHSLDGLP